MKYEYDKTAWRFGAAGLGILTYGSGKDGVMMLC